MRYHIDIGLELQLVCGGEGVPLLTSELLSQLFSFISHVTRIDGNIIHLSIKSARSNSGCGLLVDPSTDWSIDKFFSD